MPKEVVKLNCVLFRDVIMSPKIHSIKFHIFSGINKNIFRQIVSMEDSLEASDFQSNLSFICKLFYMLGISSELNCQVQILLPRKAESLSQHQFNFVLKILLDSF